MVSPSVEVENTLPPYAYFDASLLATLNTVTHGNNTEVLPTAGA
jgi:hypothetical protein